MAYPTLRLRLPYLPSSLRPSQHALSLNLIIADRNLTPFPSVLYIITTLGGLCCLHITRTEHAIYLLRFDFVPGDDCLLVRFPVLCSSAGIPANSDFRLLPRFGFDSGEARVKLATGETVPSDVD